MIDELPMLACLATLAEGVTEIRGASELRVKESDRIAAVVANLRAVGADAEELPDGLRVRGADESLGGRGRDARRSPAGDGVRCAWRAVRASDRGGRSGVRFGLVSRVLVRPRAGDRVTRTRRAQPVVIAIDGPAASGKSSTAHWVASVLGYRHVDSGALYRAATAAAVRSGVAPAEWTGRPGVTRGRARDAEPAQHVVRAVHRRHRRRGRDQRRGGHSPRLSRRADAAGARLGERARATGPRRVTTLSSDGRDMGTTVFPDATLKVFLIADPWERARRRLTQQIGRRPTEVGDRRGNGPPRSSRRRGCDADGSGEGRGPDRHDLPHAA